MNKFLLLFLFFPTLLFAQSDSACYSEEELTAITSGIIKLENEINFLNQEKKIDSLLILQYKRKIELMQQLLDENQKIFELKDTQMKLMDETIEILKRKNPWYQRPVIMYTAGIITAYITARMAGEIIGR